MKPTLIIAAANGFLGQSLIQKLSSTFRIVALVRKPMDLGSGVVCKIWDGIHLDSWSEEFEGAHAVINLAGRSINCRYTEKNKQEILISRLQSTQVLGEAIQACKQPPKKWMNCSSVTIYPYSYTEPQDEYVQETAHGFSVDVCRQWEEKFRSYAHPSVQQIVLRISVVLDEKEGAMSKLIPITKWGGGGASGSGQQQFSWIHIDDFCDAVEFLLRQSDTQGIYNICSPNPVTNKKFMHDLREILGVPIGIAQPAWLVKIGAFIIGTEPELVLESRYVVPTRLLEAGFTFQFPEIRSALENLLKPSN